MFHLKTIVTLLALGASSVTAAPASEVSARQAVASVYACQNSRWALPCSNFNLTPGACLNVPSGWNDNISSIKNNNKNVYHCVWYEHANCGGRSYGNQEDANLADGNGFFNDRISSWRCNTRQRRVAGEDNVTEGTVEEIPDAVAKE